MRAHQKGFVTTIAVRSARRVWNLRPADLS